jgi:hypothetical protein
MADEDRIQSFITMLEAENRMAFATRARELYKLGIDEEFSSVEEERFAPFYSSLRDGLQDAYLYRHDFEAWKKYRTRDPVETTKRESMKRIPTKSKFYSRHKSFSGEK